MIFIYSPKIAEDLIPVLYRIGKREGRPMTMVVDSFLRNSIEVYLGSIRADENIGFVNSERNADKPPAKMSADNSSYRSTLAASLPDKKS